MLEWMTDKAGIVQYAWVCTRVPVNDKGRKAVASLLDNHNQNKG